MMKKWTIIGGGSVRAVFFAHSLARRAKELHVGTLCLYDTDVEKLHLIGTIASYAAAQTAPDMRVVLETDEEAAICGTDYFVTTIRVGGDHTRVEDEDIARKYGILGQETTGAGGFFMAARSLPVLADYCEKIQRKAPQAWIFNFTNPSGLMTQALRDMGYDRVIGICDTPSSTKLRIAEAMGYDNSQFYLEFFGLNHLSWARRAIYQERDVLDDILQNKELTKKVGELGMFDPEFLELLGHIPNEYLYYYYYRDEAVSHIAQSNCTRGHLVESNNLQLMEELRQIDPKQNPEAALKQYLFRMYRREAAYMTVETGGKQVMHVPDTLEMPSGEGYAGIAMDFAAAIESGQPGYVILSVPNQGSISGLADTDVVEITCQVNQDGPHPVHIGKIADEPLALMIAVKTYENLTVEAIRTRSKRVAVRALLAHPLIGSYSIAKGLVADFTRQGSFIGTWHE